MSFWSTQTLRSQLPGIVIKYHPNRTKEGVHELSMGSEYLVTQDSQTPDHVREAVVQLKERQSFVIPPGHFGFLLTEEVLNIPDDALGFVSIATKVKFSGLVNISGFHVDPGYKGRLIFAVFNAGPKAVSIRQGDQIFRLWMASLDHPDSRPRRKDGFMDIPSEVANNIGTNLESLQSLSKRLETLNNHVTILKWVAGVAVGLFIAMGAATFAPAFVNYWTSFPEMSSHDAPSTDTHTGK